MKIVDEEEETKQAALILAYRLMMTPEGSEFTIYTHNKLIAVFKRIK